MGNEDNKQGCSKCKCEICCKLIPESSALTAEGADYVSYFCGTECYEKWRNKQKSSSSNESQES